MWGTIPPPNPPPLEGDLKWEFFVKFVKLFKIFNLFNLLNFLILLNLINPPPILYANNKKSAPRDTLFV